MKPITVPATLTQIIMKTVLIVQLVGAFDTAARAVAGSRPTGDPASRSAKNTAPRVRRAGLDLFGWRVPPSRSGREPYRGRPSVIYLDEPTTGLDPAMRDDVWNMIRLRSLPIGRLAPPVGSVPADLSGEPLTDDFPVTRQRRK
jgi:hypothetical protein